MSMEHKKETFEFTYSAKQREEVQRIREKYAPKEPDKMEQLRRLDASATRKGTAVSLAVGIVGALVLGVGMCCCLVWNLFFPGILIGVMGMVGVALAYPLFERVTRLEREKIAPEIIRLTDELMQ